MLEEARNRQWRRILAQIEGMRCPSAPEELQDHADAWRREARELVELWQQEEQEPMESNSQELKSRWWSMVAMWWAVLMLLLSILGLVAYLVISTWLITDEALEPWEPIPSSPSNGSQWPGKGEMIASRLRTKGEG